MNGYERLGALRRNSFTNTRERRYIIIKGCNTAIRIDVWPLHRCRSQPVLDNSKLPTASSPSLVSSEIVALLLADWLVGLVSWLAVVGCSPSLTVVSLLVVAATAG